MKKGFEDSQTQNIDIVEIAKRRFNYRADVESQKMKMLCSGPNINEGDLLGDTPQINLSKPENPIAAASLGAATGAESKAKSVRFD